MLLTAKPFSSRTLAQAVRTTEQAVHSVMLSLVDKGSLFQREVGTKRKTTLYWANQEKRSKDTDNARATPQEMANAEREAEDLQRRHRAVAAELGRVRATPDNAALDAACERARVDAAAAERELAALRERVAAAASGATADPTRVKRAINAVRSEWRTRRDTCRDFCDKLADALEKKPKDVTDLLGVDTDESEGVRLPPKWDV